MASSRARASVDSSATTSLTSPCRRACGATRQPVNSMRSAWNLPTARTRRWVPPAPGITPDLDLRLGELCRLAGDDQVAMHRQFAAAAQGEAVDRGDHRLRAARDGFPVALAVAAVQADRRARREIAEIGASCKAARVAGEHDDADRRIRAERLEVAGEALARLVVQRVPGLRTIEAKQGDIGCGKFEQDHGRRIGGHGLR